MRLFLVLSTPGCADTVNKSAKEQAWTVVVHRVLLKYSPTLPRLLQNAWTSFWEQSAQAIAPQVWQG